MGKSFCHIKDKTVCLKNEVFLADCRNKHFQLSDQCKQVCRQSENNVSLNSANVYITLAVDKSKDKEIIFVQTGKKINMFSK